MRVTSHHAAFCAAPDAPQSQVLPAEAAARRRFLSISARREFVAQGETDTSPRLRLIEGWAGRCVTLADGRRQIIDLFLPGDIIAAERDSRGRSRSSLLAISAVLAEKLAPPDPDSAADSAVATDFLAARLRHITRLGRLNAYERITDLMLELHQRMARAGLARGGSFEMPLTQELMADLLGLTSVHINRTISQLKREGTMSLGNGRVELHNVGRLPGAFAAGG